MGVAFLFNKAEKSENHKHLSKGVCVLTTSVLVGKNLGLGGGIILPEHDFVPSQASVLWLILARA